MPEFNFFEPSATNVNVPSWEATNRLLIDYARNVNKFPLPRYIQYLTGKKSLTGFYMRRSLDQKARVINDNGSDHAWADGQLRPVWRNTLTSLQNVAYNINRYDFGFMLGEMTIDAMDGLFAAQEADVAQQAMTQRTAVVQAMLNDTANWGTHTADVTAIPGNTGNWADSTTARQDIKRTIDYVRIQIMLATNSAFDVGELNLVMNPITAKAVAESQELADYLKGSYWSYPRFTADLPGQLPAQGANAPQSLYGINIVIEDTVQVTNQKGLPRAAEFVMPTGVAQVLARPGGIDAPPGGGPSFSTATMMFYPGYEMQVQTDADSWNKVTKYAVSDAYAPLMTSPISGYYLTNICDANGN